jgi:hypothetical protein
LLLQQIAAQLGTRQVPLLLVSSRTVAPLAVGFGRPAVILPGRLLGAVSDNELRDVLMHEVTHLRRGDQWVVLLQALAGALYWPIVSVHALNRELQRAREELCDNIVLAGRDAISYGRTLLHVAELLAEPRPMGAAVGILGGPGELERRIAGLLNPRRNTMTATGRKTSYFVMSLFLAAGALLSATRFAASASREGGPQADPERPAATPGAERSDPGPADKALSEDEKREIAAMQWGLRHRHEFKSDSYEDSLIGGLVENGWWSSELPLAPTQAAAIKKLDELIRDAGDDAARAVADSLDTNPTGYQESIARFDRRIRESIRRAERMVALGLLTEPQAAFVLYRYTSGDNHLYVLRDRNVQERLGMTASQNEQLDKVGEAANRREALLNLWTVDPIEQEYVRTVMAANQKRMNAEALNVLTPSQRTIWDAFTAKRSLPAKAPEMPAPSRDEAARIKIGDVSPVFRVLDEKADAFKLSAAQKKSLSTLEEIARVGLHWISLRKSEGTAPAAADPVSKARAEFVQQAEQVALLGILTEEQAEQVQSALQNAKSGTRPKH